MAKRTKYVEDAIIIGLPRFGLFGVVSGI